MLAGVGVAAYLQLEQRQGDTTAEQVLGVARPVRPGPRRPSATSGPPDPTALLQPFAEQVRRDTGTDFVVVMTPDGIRYSHPNPAEIGAHFAGADRPRAAEGGGGGAERRSPVRGGSVRAVVPVRGRRTRRRRSSPSARRSPPGQQRDDPSGACSFRHHPRLALAARRGIGVVAGQPLAPAHHPRPRARRAQPGMYRVLRRGAARRARRRAPHRPDGPRAAGQQRSAAAARAARGRIGGASTTLGLPGPWAGARLGGGTAATRSTSPPTGLSW